MPLNRRNVPLETAEKIRELSYKGFSVTKICNSLRVGKETVNRAVLRQLPCDQEVFNAEEKGTHGMYQRCKTCGARVRLPCLECRIKQLKNSQKNKRNASKGKVPQKS